VYVLRVSIVQVPQKARKAFFFEKKKQKTFALAPVAPDDSLIDLARTSTEKSFLLPFFKKIRFFLP
jgi:hypothetical protein